jgi:hypothetical protein
MGLGVVGLVWFRHRKQVLLLVVVLVLVWFLGVAYLLLSLVLVV